MRYLLMSAAVALGVPLAAQSLERDFALRLGVAAESGYGAEFEFRVGARAHAWVGGYFEEREAVLSFGVDTSRGVPVARAIVGYPGARRTVTARAGLSFVVETDPRWHFVYAPVVGVRHGLATTAAYETALLREDLQEGPADFSPTVYRPATYLQLGGRLAARWSFHTRAYVEGSVLALGSRRIGGAEALARFGWDPALLIGYRL